MPGTEPGKGGVDGGEKLPGIGGIPPIKPGGRVPGTIDPGGKSIVPLSGIPNPCRPANIADHSGPIVADNSAVFMAIVDSSLLVIVAISCAMRLIERVTAALQVLHD